MSMHVSVQVVEQDESATTRKGLRSRAELLKAAAVGGGTLLVGGVLIEGLPAMTADAAPSKSGDIAIWNFALTLEYLEAAFYTEAEAKGELSGPAAQFAQVVGGHERDHVAFLKHALGSAAVAKPVFSFGDTTSDQTKFMTTAIALEDTGVAAYNGQGPNLTVAGRGPAAMIVSVEARHAAWIRDIANENPAPAAFDAAKTKTEVLAAVHKTHFVS